MTNPDHILEDTEKRMRQSIESMIHDFSTFRTGRANPLVLQRISVECYGAETPLNQIANIGIPEPRQIAITPYDKSMLGAIEKAILKSDLGLTPNNDGTTVRLNFPPMTEERRKELVKQVNVRTEQACVAIRNIRRDAIESYKAAQKDKLISEDDLKTYEAHIQKITDKYITETHDLQKKKDQELMEV